MQNASLTLSEINIKIWASEYVYEYIHLKFNILVFYDDQFNQ